MALDLAQLAEFVVDVNAYVSDVVLDFLPSFPVLLVHFPALSIHRVKGVTESALDAVQSLFAHKAPLQVGDPLFVTFVLLLLMTPDDTHKNASDGEQDPEDPSQTEGCGCREFIHFTISFYNQRPSTKMDPPVRFPPALFVTLKALMALTDATNSRENGEAVLLGQ